MLLNSVNNNNNSAGKLLSHRISQVSLLSLSYIIESPGEFQKFPSLSSHSD